MHTKHEDKQLTSLHEQMQNFSKLHYSGFLWGKQHNTLQGAVCVFVSRRQSFVNLLALLKANKQCLSFSVCLDKTVYLTTYEQLSDPL